MNKKVVYTLAMFLVTIAFVYAGMYGMSRLMEYREMQILSENGEFEVQDPARTWHEVLEASIDKNKADMKNTEEVVGAFNEKNKEVILEPGDEYIDRDTAIETAKMWIDTMDISRLFSEVGWLGDCTATLVTRVEEDEEDSAVYNTDYYAEPYYSYWIVRFENTVANISLYVNAWSNSVWNAQIVLFDEVSTYNADIRKFLEVVGTDMLDDFATYTGVAMLEQESEYFKKMGIDTGTGNVSETVIEESGGYAVTRIGYDSDIYAMMEIRVISDDELYNNVIVSESEFDDMPASHIMVSYSLQL